MGKHDLKAGEARLVGEQAQLPAGHVLMNVAGAGLRVNPGQREAMLGVTKVAGSSRKERGTQEPSHE